VLSGWYAIVDVLCADCSLVDVCLIQIRQCSKGHTSSSCLFASPRFRNHIKPDSYNGVYICSRCGKKCTCICELVQSCKKLALRPWISWLNTKTPQPPSLRLLTNESTQKETVGCRWCARCDVYGSAVACH